MSSLSAFYTKQAKMFEWAGRVCRKAMWEPQRSG